LLLADDAFALFDEADGDDVWNVPDFIDTGLGCQVGEFSES
jgi:hypothetical protein